MIFKLKKIINMKLLVLCSSYPDNNGNIGLNYVHTRNISYVKSGINVTVIRFDTDVCYIKDGVKVISLTEYEKSRESQYDILVCHAANLKYHYRFLHKYADRFSNIVFFYHGHEVMKLNTEYPKEYSYLKHNLLSELYIPAYDKIKFALWRNFLQKNVDKLHLVFVSDWMYDVFKKNIKIDDSTFQGRIHIIYNSVSKKYETLRYNVSDSKEYDFVTIRANIDTSKFAIDLVNKFAFNNPDYKFLLVGKGTYFEHFEKANNIERIEKYLNQDEIVEILNRSRCALMPTRVDAQGVMACEMATYGIPLITSDIPVCRYVLKDFSDVAFIDNESDGRELPKLLESLKPCIEGTNERFFEKNTIDKEIKLYKNIISKA